MAPWFHILNRPATKADAPQVAAVFLAHVARGDHAGLAWGRAVSAIADAMSDADHASARAAPDQLRHISSR